MEILLILWNLRKPETSLAHDAGRNGDTGGNGHNSAGVRESVGRGSKWGKPEPVAIYR